MSLINNMLKDLEKRKAQKGHDAATENIGSEQLEPSSRRKTFFKHYWPWIVLIIVVIVAAIYFSKTTQFKAPRVNSKPMTAVSILQPKMAVVSQAKWQADSGSSFLLLYISSPIHYQLQKISATKIKLTLLNTTIPQSMLDSLDKTKKLLTDASVLQQKNDSILMLTLKHPGQVTAIELGKKPPSLRLVLNITKPKKVSSAQAKKELLPFTQRQKAQFAYERVAAMIVNGQTPEAVRDLQVMIKQYPDFTDAYLALVTLQVQRGQQQKAMETEDLGLKQMPANIKLLSLKAHLLIANNKSAAALKLLNTQSPSMQDYPSYYSLKAMVAAQTGHYVLASTYFSRLLRINPNASGWWLGMAIALEHQKELQQAAYAYSKALDTGHLSAALQAYANARLTKINSNG